MANRNNPFENLNLPNLDLTKMDMPGDLDEMEAQINGRLDEFEGALPAPLDSMFRLQRTMFETTYTMTRSAAESVNETSSVMANQAQKSAQRFVDTFMKQVKILEGDATRMTAATRNAAGDVGASVDKATKDVNRRVEKLGDEVVDYDNWTKDELYDAAQELDIPGRSSMNKQELATAVRRARQSR